MLKIKDRTELNEVVKAWRRDKLQKSYPFFDIVFGTHTLHKFPQDLYNVILMVI